MERKSNIFWGAILILFGFLFLGTNLDWFELNWTFRKIAQFWPILLILAGVAAFFSNKKSIYNATSALLIAFAIPIGIFTCVDDGVKDIKDEISDGINIDIDDFDDEEDDYSSNSDTTKGDRNKQYFAVEMSPEVKEATLKLGGGAAEFDLEESPNRLFEATTLLNFKTGYTLEEETLDGTKVINFSMKDKKGKSFNFGEDNSFNNDVLLKLSTAPVWNIDLRIGAGELDFDFTNYKVKKLDIETGVASIDIKLGDKQDKVDVDIESGVASVKSNYPKA